MMSYISRRGKWGEVHNQAYENRTPTSNERAYSHTISHIHLSKPLFQGDPDRFHHGIAYPHNVQLRYHHSHDHIRDAGG